MSGPGAAPTAPALADTPGGADVADATAGAITPETMGKLATASANGRMLLAMVTLWLDREVGPAVAAMNDDLRGLSDTAAATAQRSLGGTGDPDALARAMADLLDEVGSLDLVSPAAWRRARRLAGAWLAR